MQKLNFLLVCFLVCFSKSYVSSHETAATESYDNTESPAELKLQKQVCDKLVSGNKLKYKGLKIWDNTRIIVFNNVTANVLFAIDLKNDIFILRNRSTEYGAVTDIRNQRGVYVNLNFNSNQSIADRLKNITTLKVYFDRKKFPKAEHYPLSNLPTKVLRAGNAILVRLIGGPIPGLKQNPKAGLKLGVTIAQTMIKLLNGHALRGILPLLDRQSPRGTIIDLKIVLEALDGILNGELSLS